MNNIRGNADFIRNIETFLYDLVDITRQGLANTAPIFYNKIQKGYRYLSAVRLQ